MREARRLKRRANLARWLGASLPIMTWTLAGAAVVALAWRLSGGSSLAIFSIFGGAIVLPLVVGWLMAGRSRFSVTDMLWQMDVDLGLDARLSSAANGVGEWPAPAPVDSVALRWRMEPFIRPLALPCIACLLSFYLPLPAPVGRSPSAPIAEPSAWSSLDESLAAVEREKIAAPESIDAFRSALEELRSKPQSEWFDEGSLEATDRLKAGFNGGLERIGQNLAAAQAALTASRGLDPEAFAGARNELDRRFSEAGSGLASGSLALSPEGLRQLKAIDPQSVRKLSKAEWREARERMEQWSKTCSECSGGKAIACSGASDPSTTGGVNRGPGVAPLNLAKDAPVVTPGARGELPSSDPASAVPTDLVGMAAGRHDVQPDATDHSAPNAFTAGKGGEAVKAQRVSPQEEAVIGLYFQ